MDSKALVRRIMTIAYNIDGVYTYLSKKSGAKANELSLFYALNDGKLHSQKTISEEWYIPKTTLNTIIKEHEALGHITLESSGKGREMHICLTDSGKAYANELLQHLYEIEAAALKAATDKYGTEFIEAMEYYTECFEKNSGINNK